MENKKISSKEVATVKVEKWMPLIIDGIVFNYCVSNFGRVFGTYRNKFIIPNVTDKGYLRVNIYWPDHKKHRKFFVHRLVGYLYVPGYSPELTINHKDGKHDNNYFENLEWVTEEENEFHAYMKKFHPSGSNHPNSKYVEDQIRKVCELLEKGVGCMEISRQTGISEHVVHDIKYRKTWVDVSKDYVWDDNMPEIELLYRKKILMCLKEGMRTKEILAFLGLKSSNRMKNIINKLRISYNNSCNLMFNDYPCSA